MLSVGIFDNNEFIYLFSTFTFFSVLIPEELYNEVFFSDKIFSIKSTFIIYKTP